jgi:hypothetical protein
MKKECRKKKKKNVVKVSKKLTFHTAWPEECRALWFPVCRNRCLVPKQIKVYNGSTFFSHNRRKTN